MTLAQKLLKVLARVPVPYLPQVAQVVDAILTIRDQAHAEAIANGVTPPTHEELRQLVIDASVAAAEPWARIQAGAEGAADVTGYVVAGSTGE